ncbi:MAG: LLM class flavin-dependent oxidoreductase [Vallitalea sp.]|jgi:hypothetical protein|nr:LLM class flavin-dependent oxidoreductase [Vallitalea sp.]
MDLKDEIKYYVWSSGFEMQQIAEKLGMSKQQFNNKLSQGTLRYSEAKRIAEICGYRMKWEKK